MYHGQKVTNVCMIVQTVHTIGLARLYVSVSMKLDADFTFSNQQWIAAAWNAWSSDCWSNVGAKETFYDKPWKEKWAAIFR